MSPPIARGKRWSVADTPTTRADVPAPVTWAELMQLLARGVDEAHIASRMNR